MVRIPLQSCVDGLGRYTVKAREFFYRYPSGLLRTDSFYILIGELALTGGGMVVNRCFSRASVVDIVHIIIDGEGG